MEEQAAKRAAQLERLAALPEHLRLGVTLPGMREQLSELPSDAVEQINAKVPLDKKTGQPKYPKNKALNGYVQQLLMAAWEKEDGLAVCERLQKRGSPHVGEATVFVSWFLDTPIATLLDALANFLEQQGLREEDTFFWVCDYVIRQTDVKTDLAWLGKCVSAVNHTALLMEPWHAPAPLQRAYCIAEVCHTQKSGAQFDVVMSTVQQAAFGVALVDDFASIKMSLSKVDVRTAKCSKPEDTKAILGELEQGVGFVKCNTLVIGLLREALVAQGRAAMALLPAAKRGTSCLVHQLGLLLMDMGRLEKARPLLEEALQARQETLGDYHPDTLVSINSMGTLLQAMGQLEEAKPLLEEVLYARRATLGDRHESTLVSISNMGLLLQFMGQLEEAELLWKEAMQVRKETLGDRHIDTLGSISRMAGLLREKGELEEARLLYKQAMGQLEEARLLLEEALPAQKETLGDHHPHTLITLSYTGELLRDMDQLEEARPMLEEALQACRKTLGDRHPQTLHSISNKGMLLKHMGHLKEARPLLEEALQARKETLGDRHPDTLLSIGNMSDLLRSIGSLPGAL